MPPKQKLKVVIGLGKTGFSCVNYLWRKGCNVAVIDSRHNPPFLYELTQQYPQIPVHLGDFAADFFQRAEEIIISPGVSLLEKPIAAAIAQGIPVVGDIELFVREAKAPIVAITGSNGKSTVTTLVGEMAKLAGINVRVGGNLGNPALDLLDNEAELYVLELSSFQLETTYSLGAAAAVNLNISEDHMDRYDNLAAYAKVKKRIYKNCKVAVVNSDDPLSYSDMDLPEKVLRFGLQDHEVDFGITKDLAVIGGKFFVNKDLFNINNLKIKGLHQVANALAALALGSAINLPLSAMYKALEEFPGLPHRCQWVRTLNRIVFYNDSKGTNVGATIAAIEGFGKDSRGEVVLIAGGIGKDADFTLMREAISKYVRTVILIGKDAKLIAHALDKDTKIIFADSMHDAVVKAYKSANLHDVVLLSPACASFDMFDNFEHRGEVFMKEVHDLRDF